MGKEEKEKYFQLLKSRKMMQENQNRFSIHQTFLIFIFLGVIYYQNIFKMRLPQGYGFSFLMKEGEKLISDKVQSQFLQRELVFNQTCFGQKNYNKGNFEVKFIGKGLKGTGFFETKDLGIEDPNKPDRIVSGMMEVFINGQLHRVNLLDTHPDK